MLTADTLPVHGREPGARSGRTLIWPRLSECLSVLLQGPRHHGLLTRLTNTCTGLRPRWPECRAVRPSFRAAVHAEIVRRLCQHIFDRIGCVRVCYTFRRACPHTTQGANAPAKYEEGVFESCLGDNQDPPGGACSFSRRIPPHSIPLVYTGANGQVSTCRRRIAGADDTAHSGLAVTQPPEGVEPVLPCAFLRSTQRGPG
jgi:hypothetical protein